MATGQPYRKKDVDNVEVLSLAHQAKSLLTKKLFQETKEKFRYDGPGMFHTIFLKDWTTALQINIHSVLVIGTLVNGTFVIGTIFSPRYADTR